MNAFASVATNIYWCGQITLAVKNVSALPHTLADPVEAGDEVLVAYNSEADESKHSY